MGRVGEAKKELHTMLEADDLKNSHLLIFANKQDLPGALNAAVLTEQLDLRSLKGRNWHVMPCCASAGDGLFEGLDWLSAQVNKK